VLGDVEIVDVHRQAGPALARMLEEALRGRPKMPAHPV